MTTQVNGVEITPKIAETLRRWYDASISWSDTVPYYYVIRLGELQDFLCEMIDDKPEIKSMITTVLCIKKDLENFIPQKERES